MSHEETEKEFTTDIISSGRVTIPSYHLSDLDLEEGDSVRVKISKKWYDYPLFYKDKETDKIEMVMIKISTGDLEPIREEAIKILESKSVDWAFIAAGDWIIKSETWEPKEYNP